MHVYQFGGIWCSRNDKRYGNKFHLRRTEHTIRWYIICLLTSKSGLNLENVFLLFVAAIYETVLMN